MKLVPARRPVGMDDAIKSNAGPDRRDTLSLATESEGESLALALADHDDHATLAGLVHRKAAVLPILLPVLRADMTAEVSAIDLDGAPNGRVGRLSGDGLAKLVRHHKRRTVLAIEVAGELEGGMALGAIGEDRDGEQVVADRQLAVGKNGPAGDAVLRAAPSALEELAGRDEGVLEATATGSERLTLRVGPADQLERRPRLVVRQARNLREAEGAGGPSAKKVLSHGTASTFCVEDGSMYSLRSGQRF